MKRSSFLPTVRSTGTVAAVLFFAAAVGATFLAAPAPAARKEYKVIEVKGGATVKGRVKLGVSDAEKASFALPKVRHGRDNDKGCGDHEHDSERLKFDRDSLGIGYAIVYLKDVATGKEWPATMKDEDRMALIDQKVCKYVPHVQVVRTDTQMVILNSDAADHNIHGFKTPVEKNSLATTKFNFTSAPKSRNEDTADAYLEDPGLYLVKCDVHPWMNAYVLVAEHPYHTVTSHTGADGLAPGEWTLADVPPGAYTLVVWKEGMHESAQEADGKVNSYNYSDNIVREIPIQVEAGKELVVPDIVIELQKK